MKRFGALGALLWALLLGGAAWGDTPTPALQLAEGSKWAVGGHFVYWRDATGRAEVEEVAGKHLSDFKHLRDSLSLGFTPDVVWLRFTLDFGDIPDTGHVWLELGQSVMEDARLFVPTAAGGYVEVSQRTGPAHQAQRLAYRVPLFEIPRESGARTYFLRLATPTSMSTNLTVWEPHEFVKASTTETFFWGLVFGAYFLVVVFYFIFWLGTREPVHLMYTAYVFINCMAAFFTGGWPLQLMAELSAGAWLKWLGAWISLSVITGIWFTIRFLQLDDAWPRISRACLSVLGLICLTGLVGVLAGHYRDVVPILQLTSVVSIVLTLLLCVYLTRKGQREARFFLFAFSFFYIGVSWRYARNFGFLEPSFWNDNSYQIGAFIHMLVMSTGIFASYSRLRREKQAAEARALSESNLRAEQRDFVSMVSHELRTPLSIIGASSDNLLQEPGLSEKSLQRVNKIIKSSERMRQLMDSYLSKERLLLDSRPLQVGTVDLVALCQQVREELEDSAAASVDLQTSRPRLLAECDAGLVKIAVRNLVSNALRHSPPGARVVLALESRLRAVELRVSDDGTGIPEDEITHIFTRFYRGRGALDQPGAGLGLYLVRTIAERHGGWVTAQNRPGGGCEFRIQLPQ